MLYGNRCVIMTAISLVIPENLSQLLAIERRSNAFPWSAQTFDKNNGGRFINYKFEAKGKIVGFVITQVVLDEASLLNIAIEPNFQRSGYARQLLLHLIAELEKNEVITLWLEVRSSNLPAIALYEQLHFHQVSRRLNYYPTQSGYEDAIIMALIL